MSTIKPHTRVFAFLGALLFFITSCALTGAVIWQIRQDNKQQNTSQVEKENTLQGTKLAEFTPTDKIDTLKTEDLKLGDGPEVKPGDTITAHYTGAVAATGEIFQSSLDTGSPATFGLDQVIAGWQQGVPGMKVGGKRRLLIPSSMAYGEAGRPDGGIPANADLVFDIELISIDTE